MDRRKLGNSDLKVSLICLGTMTFGHQNSQEDANKQLDYAQQEGINFIDTAELYPVPGKAETYADTERMIGHWLEKRKKRKDIILATKVAGPSQGLRYMRNGEIPRLTKKDITKAVEGSLLRLHTDYIDLYQIHWPDRHNNRFGNLGYVHAEKEDYTPIEETLEALNTLKQEGHIRYIGLSNETPWGAMKYLQLAESNGWPKPISIQNPYSLVNRSFEVGLAEIAHRENLDLLAYSPLAMGKLSGKYLEGKTPPESRLALYPQFGRYNNPQADAAIEAYVKLAKAYELDPAQMALAFVNSRSFLKSNIIGATTLEQLKSNIASVRLELSEELLIEIEAIHTRYPNPAP